MEKENTFDFNTNWYELWMKQSKQFFEIAEKNFKDIFDTHDHSHTDDHFDKMQQWIDMLKQQWRFMQLHDQQKAYEAYWTLMGKMYSDAYEMLLQQCMQRKSEDNPVKNMREFYEIWLNCCHDVYERSMKSKMHQSAYGEFLNATLKYWKTAMPQ